MFETYLNLLKRLVIAVKPKPLPGSCHSQHANGPLLPTSRHTWANPTLERPWQKALGFLEIEGDDQIYQALESQN